MTDGVRLADPAMAAGNGVVRDSQILAEDRQVVMTAAVLLVVTLLPLVIALRPSQHRMIARTVRVAPRTVHRSDRLLQ
ncbi:hypothetical protein C7451_10742 [Blastomonas natatoria]|uniref:Uncharacterized protein n=1 Tax=Blastomonas natatoria TaxID=34015 RepID=A0A2V3V1Y5_9SPHN|nr:hypothetical protein C7451_10742 [Blastomonas natatoria]